MFCKLSLKFCKSWGGSSVVSLKLPMYSHKDKVCWLLLANYGRRQWHPTPILLPGKSHGRRSLEDYSPWVAKSRARLSNFTFSFHFHALEKEMATHSGILAWRIPWTEEPGGIQSMGSQRVGHNWVTNSSTFYPTLPYCSHRDSHLESQWRAHTLPRGLLAVLGKERHWNRTVTDNDGWLQK